MTPALILSPEPHLDLACPSRWMWVPPAPPHPCTITLALSPEPDLDLAQLTPVGGCGSLLHPQTPCTITFPRSPSEPKFPKPFPSQGLLLPCFQHVFQYHSFKLCFLVAPSCNPPDWSECISNDVSQSAFLSPCFVLFIVEYFQ